MQTITDKNTKTKRNKTRELQKQGKDKTANKTIRHKRSENTSPPEAYCTF